MIQNLIAGVVRGIVIRSLFTMPSVGVHVLSGGNLPQRMTKGAIGYDCCLRALVSPDKMDPENPILRETIFDFKNPPKDESVNKHLKEKEDGSVVYMMDPHESILGGIGFTTEMTFPMFYWVAPRSGLASKHGITVTNAPGTVDPDYRGEAGVLIYNRNDHPFELVWNMRICQVIFSWAMIPNLFIIKDPHNMG